MSRSAKFLFPTEGLLAVVSDKPVDLHVPLFGLDDVVGVAALIMKQFPKIAVSCGAWAGNLKRPSSWLSLLVPSRLGAVAIPITNHPTFCASCHTIAPSYESWAKSSHREVTCVACHVRPGIEGWLRDKAWAGTKDVAIYLFGTPTDPHNLQAKVDSAVCLSCHRNILRISEVAPRDLPRAGQRGRSCHEPP